MSAAEAVVPTGAGTPPSSLLRTVLRGAGVILVVTVLARLAGFLRYLVFGASVGAGDVGTAYATANLLPSVMFEIVAGGALAAVVVPLVAGLVPEGAPRPGAAGTAGAANAAARTEGSVRAAGIVSGLLGWALLVTLPLTAVLIVFAPQLASLLLGAGESSAGAVTVGTALLRIFAPQLPLYAIAVVLAAYLQARKRFLWPAMMPLLSSLVVMASYRVYAALVPTVATSTTVPDAAIAWLGWGTTAGVAVMALSVAIAAHRAGLRLRPTLRLPAGDGRRALGLGGAGLGAVAAQQGVLALVMLMAMRAGGTGTLPVFQYAQALYLLPYAILVVPLMTAMFPQLAEMRLVGDTVGLARAAAASVRTVIGLSVLGAAALIAAAPALEQFFRLIDRAGAAGVGSTTAALALGLPGYAVATQCTRILSAALRARDALLVGSAGWVIAGAAILALIVPSPLRPASEAATAFGLTISLGMALSALVGLGRIAPVIEPGGGAPQVRRSALLAPLALVVGAVPGLLLCRLLVDLGSGLVTTIAVGALAGLVGAVPAALVLLAADPTLLTTLRRRLRRSKATAAEGETATNPGVTDPAGADPAGAGPADAESAVAVDSTPKPPARPAAPGEPGAEERVATPEEAEHPRERP